jgi:hypothetical protein
MPAPRDAGIQRRTGEIDLDHLPWRAPHTVSLSQFEPGRGETSSNRFAAVEWNQMAMTELGVTQYCQLKHGAKTLMGQAENHRRYAAECLRLAQRCSNPAEKSLLVQMAETWRRLAEQADARALIEEQK